MSRPQKQCIFCSNPANSKEHFWSEWMHELLHQLPDPKHSKKTITYRPDEGRREAGPANRQGGVHTIKIRAVCDHCNNGWMNRLEKEARPFLTPLIEEKPIVLDFEQQAIIARWVALKCMVAEHASPNNAVTPREDREAFKSDGTIPSYFRIYVANHNLHSTGYLRRSNCIAFSPEGPSPPLAGTPNNIQTISFLLGSVLIHLNAARIDNFALEDRVLIPQVWNVCRVWPIQHFEVVWPHRPLLDGDGIELVADCLGSYVRASKVAWV
jgi:hypothetical protein